VIRCLRTYGIPARVCLCCHYFFLICDVFTFGSWVLPCLSADQGASITSTSLAHLVSGLEPVIMVYYYHIIGKGQAPISDPNPCVLGAESREVAALLNPNCCHITCCRLGSHMLEDEFWFTTRILWHLCLCLSTAVGLPLRQSITGGFQVGD
jgi:hypothetical protein